MTSKTSTRPRETQIGTLPEGWTVSKVREVAKVNELSINKDFKQIEIEYIDISSVENRQVLEVQHLLLSQAPSRAKRIVRDKDILIATVRPNLKHFAFVKKASSTTIASTGFAVITSFGINPYYLYYYLTTDEFTNFLSQIADTHTSAYPAFNPDIIENSEVAFPSDPREQENIAGILSALDDKIELNRQMNATLEKIGQALFKHWFIDFEFPNEKGKPYKSNGGEMVDSELGEIPKGWRVGQVSGLVNHIKDTINPNDYPEKIFFHYSIPSYDEQKRPSVEKGNFIRSNKFVVKSNSVLISKLNPRMPRVWPMGKIDESCSVCSTEFQVLVPKKRSYYGFVRFSFSSGDIKDEMKLLVTGTSSSHQRVRPEDILNLKILIPVEDVFQGFEDITSWLQQKIWQLGTENEVLIRIRDSLLPKLMSGRIRI